MSTWAAFDVPLGPWRTLASPKFRGLLEALCSSAADAQSFSSLCAEVRKRLWVGRRRADGLGFLGWGARLLTPACRLLPHTPPEALERISGLA